MQRRTRGFTLIELLVVIAIIAILAAMLFPVFARARESARKIQCLSNVKNIATAIQMYLTDFERLPPTEHRAEVEDFFNQHGGLECCCRGTWANPYLRWPVILEEYTRNRDIWRCPSQKISDTIGISPGPDWFAALVANESVMSCYGMTCRSTYPSGWGGAITDSWAQLTCAYSGREAGTSGGPFEQGLSHNRNAYDMKPSQMGDPARYMLVADIGAHPDLNDASVVAYPDLCRLRCSSCSWGPSADWVNCTASQTCGAGDARLAWDVEYRKTMFPSRHLGGVNLGFGDGHAQWFSAEAVMNGVEQSSGMWWIPAEQRNQNPVITGIYLCGMPPPA